MDYTELLERIASAIEIIATFYGLLLISVIILGVLITATSIYNAIKKGSKKRKDYKERCFKNDN